MNWSHHYKPRLYYILFLISFALSIKRPRITANPTAICILNSETFVFRKILFSAKRNQGFVENWQIPGLQQGIHEMSTDYHISERKLPKVFKCLLELAPLSKDGNIWASVKLASTMIWNKSNISQYILAWQYFFKNPLVNFGLKDINSWLWKLGNKEKVSRIYPVLSQSNQIVDKKRFLFKEVFHLKWRRNNIIRLLSFCKS